LSIVTSTIRNAKFVGSDSLTGVDGDNMSFASRVEVVLPADSDNTHGSPVISAVLVGQQCQLKVAVLQPEVQ